MGRQVRFNESQFKAWQDVDGNVIVSGWKSRGVPMEGSSGVIVPNDILKAAVTHISYLITNAKPSQHAALDLQTIGDLLGYSPLIVKSDGCSPFLVVSWSGHSSKT